MVKINKTNGTLFSPPFNDDHETFRDMIQKFVKSEIVPYVEKYEAEKGFPRELFQKFGELGVFGIRLDEKYGGLGLDYWYTVCYIEELANSGIAGLNMDLMAHGELVLPIINELGTEEQKQEFLIPAIKGEKIAALGITEPGGGSDVAALRTTAKNNGDDYIINGSKTFITNGERSDFILLAVKTEPEKSYKGVSFILFNTDTKGFSVGRTLEKLGNHSSNTAELFFDDCRVPKRYLLGKENRGFTYIVKNFQGERLLVAIAAVRGAENLWEKGVEYARTRRAFGKPIIKNQVWQHELVDLKTQIECAKLLTYKACYMFACGQECTTEITMAKLYTSELANKVADRVLQIYGGYGYMEEYPISRAFRDLRLLTIGAGTSEIMKEILKAYWRL